MLRSESRDVGRTGGTGGSAKDTDVAMAPAGAPLLPIKPSKSPKDPGKYGNSPGKFLTGLFVISGYSGKASGTVFIPF